VSVADDKQLGSSPSSAHARGAQFNLDRTERLVAASSGDRAHAARVEEVIGSASISLRCDVAVCCDCQKELTRKDAKVSVPTARATAPMWRCGDCEYRRVMGQP